MTIKGQVLALVLHENGRWRKDWRILKFWPQKWIPHPQKPYRGHPYYWIWTILKFPKSLFTFEIMKKCLKKLPELMKLLAIAGSFILLQGWDIHQKLSNKIIYHLTLKGQNSSVCLCSKWRSKANLGYIYWSNPRYTYSQPNLTQVPLV